MRARGCLLVVAVVGALQIGVARADAPPAASFADPPPVAGVADALFTQAREEMRRGNFEAACPKLAESERIDPSNGTLLNLVLCEERLGKVASAWLHARELLERLPANDDRRPIAARKVAALSARLAKLEVRLSPAAPPNTKVALDGVELGASSLGVSLPIDPGVHRLVVSASGRTDRTTEISIEEANAYEWLAEPGAPAAESPEVAGSPRQSLPAPVASTPGNKPPAARAAMTPSRPATGDPVAEAPPFPQWVGWTAGGVGVAGLMAGVVLGKLALDRKATVEEKCPDQHCTEQSYVDAADQGKLFMVSSIVGLSVGAASLGFGVYVLTRSDSSPRAGSPRSSFAMPATTIVTYGAAF